MNLQFIEITLKNFLSFGNNLTTIKFKEGLNLITGNNGSGKSSLLLDSISFCLFGKPYRNITISELINRSNKKQTEVTCKFTLNDKNLYEITRTLKPETIKIKKDGEYIQLLSSKSQNQTEIEKKIGINHKIFKQIISLSINQTEPFLKLTTPKKREITDQLFEMTIFSKMSKESKENLKKIKQDNNLIENSMNYLKENILTEQKRIKDLNNTKKSFEIDKNNDISNLTEEILTNKENLTNITKEGKLLSNELKLLSETDLNDLNLQRDGLIKKINRYEINIDNAKKDISFFEKNNKCSQCKSEISESYKSNEIAKFNKLIKSYSNELDNLNKNLTELDLKLKNIKINNNKIIEIKYKLKNLKNNFINNENEITKLKSKITIIENKTFNIDINSIKNQYKEKCNEFKLKSNTNKNNIKEIDSYEILINMLNDSGIKSYVYEQLIPILNHNISEYLNLFEIPVSIEFNKLMEVDIKTLKNYTEEVSYHSFSEGEKKRIDMAILLSFINVTKTILRCQFNILIIDELLDSSIDENGLESLIDSLESMLNKIPNMGVYIISHRLKNEYYNKFKSLMEVSKDKDDFSDIKYLK